MIRIAIVEDEDDAAATLGGFLDKYSHEYGCALTVSRYKDAVRFLTEFKSNFDIVFMDIELPMLNGMDASYKLRETDADVVLIFVTNMAQFAVQGYEVNALNFIVKPVKYFNFAQKLTRALKRAEENADGEICVNSNKTIVRLKTSKLKYIEVLGNNLLYHSETGIYKSYGRLKDVEIKLEKFNFVRCNNCYLVNLKYVTEIKSYVAVIGDEELKISRPKRKDFVRAVNNYLASGGH